MESFCYSVFSTGVAGAFFVFFSFDTYFLFLGNTKKKTKKELVYGKMERKTRNNDN